MKIFKSGFELLVMVVCIGVPSVARADDAAEAQLHFQLGLAGSQAHNYQEALTHFLHAYRLAPTASTIFNIAQTYLALHREAEAFRFYNDYLLRTDGLPGPRSVAERVLAEISPRLSRIDLQSTPAGATIYVDRTELGDFGVTPRVIAVSPGTHTVFLRHDGYRDAQQTIEAVRGRLERVNLTLDPVVGAVHIATTPVGATVEIDGVAQTSNTPIDVTLPVGMHQVRLHRAGYIDVVREVALTHAGTSLEETMPRDLAVASVLSVTTTPPGATVTVHGQRMGTSPFSGDVNAGSSLIEVRMDGRTAWQREMLLRPGRALDLRVDLGRVDASRPWWIPALTFGGAAVAVTGLVLGGFAISAHSDFNQSPNRESLDRTNTLNLAADVTTGVGMAMIVGGVMAWILTPDPRISRVVIREEGLNVQH
jgi:hypothetical protein